ncbi:hypothetical protein ACJMK2_022153 [Sinanodonta woodiana]|uniref:NAD(P)H oxidase (H2O2-forming) n=1 Tax=Sinanodonta woodiana TaxID=1069815 RepID=A0ABD3TI62_SINWO
MARRSAIFALIQILLCTAAGYGSQRFDGYYNNLNQPRLGSSGRPLEQNCSTHYADYTYQPAGSDRPSARLISEELFYQPPSSIIPSSRNFTAMFAFFSQLVALEMIDTDDTTCPVELIKIVVPKCDKEFDPECSGDKYLPYERVVYDKHTGQSPNIPRKQLNSATSYIDASFVYGASMVRATYLQADNSPLLASGDVWNKYPAKNDILLPFVANPNPVEHVIPNQKNLWKLGDKHVQENPALVSFAVLFFRWHNYLARRFQKQHPDWTSDEVFTKTRHWVKASLQNVIYYEWLPSFMKQSFPRYSGYKQHINPDVTYLFDAVALRYFITMIPSGIYQRTGKCMPVKDKDDKHIRMCNSYWKAQEVLLQSEEGVEETLMGLATQLAEEEDTMVTEDLQRKFYGPLHFSRHDYVAFTIMRGRDYGLPDYNTTRQHFGLPPLQAWEDINPWLMKKDPQLIMKLKNVYGSLDKVDAFVGAMFETTPNGPGELISAILYDQFIRVRDGDRFWFENTENGLFSEAEIMEIRTIRLYDIIVNSTNIDHDQIQPDIFKLADLPCKHVGQINSSDLPVCTSHKGYDYFAGSEVTYIIVWVCFGLIPFVCILFAYIISKFKSWNYRKQKQNMLKNIKDTVFNIQPGTLSNFKAVEWVGENENARPVVVRIKTKCLLDVLNPSGKKLRSINMSNFISVEAILSSNKGQTTVMIKVPKEYDLVLQFPTESQRRYFVDYLKETISEYERQLQTKEMKLKHIYSTAFTQKKRNAVLERFFKTVFSEAFQMDYDPQLDKVAIETRQAKEILEIELTKEEFADAMSVRPNSEFVENMFMLMDTDHNGYISFGELLNAVVLLSKGSCQDKLQTLFRMFDLECKGCLQKDELTRFFSSLLEMASSNLGKQEVADLVESICTHNGLTGQTAINFDDFCQLLSPQMDKLWNAGIEWKGCKDCYPNQERKKGADVKKKSQTTHNAFHRIWKGSPTASVSSISSGSGSSESSIVGKPTKFIAIRETYTPLKAKMKKIKHFFENNRQHIFFLVLFYGICFGLFLEIFYRYTVEREHSGLRALMSYGISFTRGAAAVMSFTFSLLLLTMCRNIITFLRGTFLNLYVPFDSHVAFHKIVAWTALFFTAIHVLGYSFNFYHLATQPTKYLCVFDSIVFRADFLPTIDFWLFGNMTGFTGVLLVIIIYIIYVFATQTARRYIFNAFWASHKLIMFLYILTILHGASIIVQKPMFHVYFVGPAILFSIDKMISLSRKRMEICVIRADNLASDVTFIEFKRPSHFEYKSGQWVRIACLAQGRNEYHPFTLTSAPHEDSLSLHIRALGPWTWNLRNNFDPENLKDGPLPKLYLDGPYGAGQQDWYQYEVSVLVGAGIGVTPYASILKDFVHMATIKSTYKIRCQKLYFIWITGSQRHFEWLLDILREVESIDEKGVVSIDIFITQFFQNFDLRTAMLYICEEHFQKLSGGRSVFTGLKAATHFGRPQLPSMFGALHKAHPQVRKVGVFSCGPPGVTKSVERACEETSRTTRALFEHHFENF